MDMPALLSRDVPTIYLNDHLAGATAGLELVGRMVSENEDGAFGAPLRKLRAEIEEDRDELISIIERLGHPVDRVKIAVGWTAEKVGRLKPNGQLRGYSPLGRMLELETLLGGITAKLALWQALEQADIVDGAELVRLVDARAGRLPSCVACTARPPRSRSRTRSAEA